MAEKLNIVNTKEGVVKLTPNLGYVLKFKQVNLPADNRLVDQEGTRKFFVNLCHCEQIPPPLNGDTITEEEVARDEDALRIPLCISHLASTTDKSGNAALKVDVTLSTIFFVKWIQDRKHDFMFNHFKRIMCAELERKEGLLLDPDRCVLLPNRMTPMGNIDTQLIPIKPEVAYIQEMIEPKSEEPDSEMENLTEAPEPKGVIIFCKLEEEELWVNMRLSLASKGLHLTNPKRLRLAMNANRVRVTKDSRSSLFDFCLPVYIENLRAKSELIIDEQVLVIKAPALLNQ